MEITRNSNKPLSVFGLVMINVVAVDSLRTLPIGADMGFSLVFYYLIAAIFYLIPTALITAELATGWPNRGGIYIWVREAFGAKVGFSVIWLQWIYNIVWYPTIISFIAATIAYLIDPSLGTNKTYMLITTITIFWATTLVNYFGMKASSIISTIGAIIGTIIPMLLIIYFGCYWLYSGKPSHVNFTWHSFFPKDYLSSLPYYIAILFGLMGLEMSAVHADEVKDPKRDYPRALIYSTILIIVTLILSSLSIAIILPHGEINIVSGLTAAFASFFMSLHASWMLPVIVLMIIIGAFAGVTTWVIGPTKGLLEASRDGNLPEWLTKTNKHGAPVNILLTQGAIFTVLCSLFLIFPDVENAYWMLSVLTAQLALLVYVMLFAAAISLRLNQPHVDRGYHVPGGNKGICILGSIGIFSCLVAIAVGFIPPKSLAPSHYVAYEAMLVFGILIFICIPWIISHFLKRS